MPDSGNAPRQSLTQDPEACGPVERRSGVPMSRANSFAWKCVAGSIGCKPVDSSESQRVAGRIDDAQVGIEGPVLAQRHELGIDDLAGRPAGGESSGPRSRCEPPEGRLGVIDPERRRALGSRMSTGSLLPRDEASPRGPGCRDLEMDRVERPPHDVVAQDGHPFREVGVERHLALDGHGDARRRRLPSNLAEPARVVHLIGQRSGRRRTAGAGRSRAPESAAWGSNPSAPVSSGFASEETTSEPVGGLGDDPVDPRGTDPMRARSDLERIFAQGDPAGDPDVPARTGARPLPDQVQVRSAEIVQSISPSPETCVTWMPSGSSASVSGEWPESSIRSASTDHGDPAGFDPELHARAGPGPGWASGRSGTSRASSRENRLVPLRVRGSSGRLSPRLDERLVVDRVGVGQRFEPAGPIAGPAHAERTGEPFDAHGLDSGELADDALGASGRDPRLSRIARCRRPSGRQQSMASVAAGRQGRIDAQEPLAVLGRPRRRPRTGREPAPSGGSGPGRAPAGSWRSPAADGR